MGRQVRTAVCTIVVCNTFEPPIIKRPPRMQRVNGYLLELVAYESQTEGARLFKMRSLDTSSFERDRIAYDI